jgi:hypothetical protein
MPRASVCPSCKRAFLNERALKSHICHRSSKCKQLISDISQEVPEIILGNSGVDEPNLLAPFNEVTHVGNYSENCSEGRCVIQA